MEDDLKVDRARTGKGLCQECEKCKEQREELNRQKLELERKARLEVKRVKVKKRASKVKELQ